MIEEQIIELETRLAFQEDQLDQLNRVISDQQLELVELRKIIKFLHEQIETLLESSEQSSEQKVQERPPHY